MPTETFIQALGKMTKNKDKATCLMPMAIHMREILSMAESKDPEYTHGSMAMSIKERLSKTSNMESESFVPSIPILFYNVSGKMTK